MKIDLVTYEPAHCHDILDFNAKKGQPRGRIDWEKVASSWHTAGPAYTLMVDGKIMGSAGLVIIDDKKAEAWLMFSMRFYKHKTLALRILIKEFKKLIAEHKFTRVQAVVPTTFFKGQRFVEWLGFQKEGVLRKYGPENEDMIMYSKISENGGHSRWLGSQ